MTIVEAIIVGALQGLTEFLPVSSSGHLILAEKFFGVSEPMLLFDTAVHGGTLLAVFVVLRKDIWKILKKPLQPLTWYLILATIPAVAAALIFKDYIEDAYSYNRYFIGGAFLLTSTALLIAELLSSRRLGRRREEIEMNNVDALLIGVMQAAAILPGVSRSGFTLSGALSRRLDRDFAARFSFLLSIPAIIGAVVLQVRDLTVDPTPILTLGIANLAAGTLTAAVVGFFAVSFMLRIIKRHALWGFSIYTAALGLIVLIFL
jgi:undecaprenyl-diphosphatase